MSTAALKVLIAGLPAATESPTIESRTTWFFDGLVITNSFNWTTSDENDQVTNTSDGKKFFMGTL